MKFATTFNYKMKPFTLTFLNSFLVFLSIGDMLAISKSSFQNTLYSENKNTLATKSKTKLNLQDENTIAITGSASRVLDTNFIRLGLKIETKSGDLQEAYANNTKISNDVSDVLRRLRVPNRNITTTNFKMEPIYLQEFNEQNKTWTQVFDGYRVINEIEINIRKRQDISDIIDAIVQAGPVYITGINFGFSDELVKKTKDELLQQAALDAYQRAKVLTDVLGVDITDVKSISISQYTPPIPYNVPYAASAIQDRAINEPIAIIPPTIYAGTSRVSAEVNVNFLFKNLHGNETARNETPLQINPNRTQVPSGEEGNATNATQPGNQIESAPEEIPPEEGNATNVTQPTNKSLTGAAVEMQPQTGVENEFCPEEYQNEELNATEPQLGNQTAIREEPFGPEGENATEASNMTLGPQEEYRNEGNVTSPEEAVLPQRRNATGETSGFERNQTSGNQTEAAVNNRTAEEGELEHNLPRNILERS